MEKYKTTCPICKEEVIEDCKGCIEAGTLVHQHGKDVPDIMEVEWQISI